VYVHNARVEKCTPSTYVALRSLVPVLSKFLRRLEIYVITSSTIWYVQHWWYVITYVRYCEVELIPLWEYDTATHSIMYVWYCEVELIPLWEYDTATHSITYVWYCEVELIPLWEYDTSTIWYVQRWWYDVPTYRTVERERLLIQRERVDYLSLSSMRVSTSNNT
jgi:hypothetical protein